MIPTDLSSRLHLIQQSQVQAPAAAAEILPTVADFAAGQRISARITAAQSNGVFRAEVDGKMINLTVNTNNLGKPVGELTGIGPGQTLDLLVTGREHRTVTTQLLSPSPRDATELSNPAKLIGNLLAGGEPEAAPLAKGAAIMASPTPEAFRALPQQLRQAVSESGLFYESHQADWVAGKLPATALLREPQGSHSALAGTLAALRNPSGQIFQTQTTLTSPSPGPLSDAADLPGQIAGTRGKGEISQASAQAQALAGNNQQGPASLPLRLLQGALLYQAEQYRWEAQPANLPASPAAGEQAGTGNRIPTAATDSNAGPELPAQATTAAAPSTGAASQPSDATRTGMPAPSGNPPAAANAGIPQDVQPLVRQQLDAADTRQLFWQGQIWPGQDMEWRIEEDGRHDGNDDESPQKWKTSLRLVLPRLGHLDASLTLGRSGLSVTVATDEVKSLRDAVPDLADALAAAGVAVANIGIVPNEASE